MASTLSDLELERRGPDVDDVPVDKLLVLRYQMGNPEAYAEIFERYRPLTERICYRILGSREDAQEAVQETMLRVLRGLETFNGRYQLQAWIARIATNVSVDMVRARARRPQSGAGLDDIDEASSDDELDPEAIVTRILEQERVRAVLDDIPEHHREVLLLREFEGRSHEEIAGTMGVSPAQAKALIHRAKGTFRRAWGEDRHGVAAFAPWFLIPSLFRRIADAAQTLGGRVAATPVMAEATATTAEKVTAAAVAVVVAGTVGVGALAVRHAHHAPAKPSPVVVIAPVAPATTPLTVERPLLPPKTRSVKPHKKPHKAVVPIVVVAPSPGSDPSVTPGSPSTDPSPSGNPSPGPSTPPVVGPAPAWGMNFTAGTAWDGACGDCPAAAWLVSSQVSGTAGQSVTIAQVAEGSALDSLGHPSWKVYLQYWGSADGDSGQLQYQFKLATTEGWYTYSGAAVLTSIGSVG